ncbi:elix-turn-helix domain-containing protein [Ktedonobacteria bacterium brp13]|nr:helix-turn-helix domain-containing protein [Ktedonobacteria bacterium brp13]BCL80884.1 helix-turn-helix domain-containing protein [Ktedonobacteria bacterium brp13]BCL82615.1 helix-turn-helix domain-containing protein [Ktedonobacteria bacterium brp13]BCL84560.1 elix-turn-helix domain-containing protein [Ktedonobacteria bacterium brp13]
MGTPQKFPLRELTQHEREELSQKAAGEEVSVGKRAKALLALANGCSFAQAGKQVGMSCDGISQLAARFFRSGLDALFIAPGRGRKPSYTTQDHELILREMQRRPTWDVDQCTVWSLSLLQKSLQARGFLDICPKTIRLVLQAHGWKYQQTTRTWHLIDQVE